MIVLRNAKSDFNLFSFSFSFNFNFKFNNFKKEYFEFIDRRRRMDLLELNKKYKLIGPLVTKVEGIVFNTNSSKSPKMVGYYQFWEKEIFKTLSRVNYKFFLK